MKINVQNINSFFVKAIKKVKIFFNKSKNQIRIIWKDPLERYILIFLLAFIFAITTFFILKSIKNKVEFVITGTVARVKDGDTFVIGDKVINLYGVDAPELEQKCGYYNVNTQKKSLYPCGRSAKRYLKSIVNFKKVRCDVKDKDRYGRYIAICYVMDKNEKAEDVNNIIEVNKKMVFDGYAVAYKKYSKKYIKDQYIAKKHKKGIWTGDFVEPNEYRRGAR